MMLGKRHDCLPGGRMWVKEGKANGRYAPAAPPTRPTRLRHRI
jgi:hypothetical protein